MQKRLGVFISSTYTDLREEREAAIAAVLRAKHVPFGMESFAAGAQTPLETVTQWIDTCDVYMLILGGRYGSIEPASGRGYVELEYEYARDHGKELFALVLSDGMLERKVKGTLGRAAVEDLNGRALAEFKKDVLLKLSGMCDDVKDITIQTLSALADIATKPTVVGWVSGVEAQRLLTENEQLRGEISSLRDTAAEAQVRSADSDAQRHIFENLSKTLKSLPLTLPGIPSVLDGLTAYADGLTIGGSVQPEVRPLVAKLAVFGLVDITQNAIGIKYTLTSTGRALLAYLFAKRAGVKL